MTTILIGKEGTPIINGQGALTVVSGNTEFRQRLVNIFSTQKYSETLFPEYGFDYISLVRNTDKIDKALALRSVAVDALNPRNVFGMDKLITLDVEISGATGSIDITLSTSAGQLITESLTLGE